MNDGMKQAGQSTHYQFEIPPDGVAAVKKLHEARRVMREACQRWDRAVVASIQECESLLSEEDRGDLLRLRQEILAAWGRGDPADKQEEELEEILVAAIERGTSKE